MEAVIFTKILYFFTLFLTLLFIITSVTGQSPCNGTIAECNEELEILMESDISRRFLEERKKYISPGALKRDQPVCNGGGGGEPYSRSCLPPPSNPYNRGCSKYYRCRGDQ
ncbi:protein RALF-like 32 [Nicotiana tomentosiformis]|uniref:Protein RALF-like 32 n=2 Tax=Nicotiana TaxID=4085 RepID=A0A1S4C7B1_TOBAC|nr:protein RALF-like 32 [Nicotiana tomentosiformis]XP_016497033.1 PREDICTED: protein RALF-like 32 [Nicotiana tabacum]